MEEKKTETTTTPRIYVASLADYNAGHLLGRWIDADQSADDIRGEIAEMLEESKEPIAEEWAIHDYKNFGSLHLSEFEDIKYVSEVARLMGEYGTFFAALVGRCSDIEEAQRYMGEAYCGEFDRLDDYAEQLVQECYSSVSGKLPEFIRCHIDFEGIAQDMELRGDVFTIQDGGKVHVFNADIY